MAPRFRCPLCLDSGNIKRFRASHHIKSHLGGLSTHNLGPFACSHPGCELRNNRADRNMKHRDANGEHDAVWTVDLVLKAQISELVDAGRYDSSEIEDDDDDENDNAAAPELRAHPRHEELSEHSADVESGLTIRIDGIWLREEIFALLFEVIDDELKVRDGGDFVAELDDLEVSLERQREACIFEELVALVKVLAKTSRLEHSLTVLDVWYDN
ncbi:hypothetical protein QM012_005413 [Aureobasidium pullulans]|uniref:C2H2-type domain-containing protein n=1 Tax=Aureobasidium pullulans TaxID=5580 RepID=A0ABR0T698_AURPU